MASFRESLCRLYSEVSCIKVVGNAAPLNDPFGQRRYFGRVRGNEKRGEANRMPSKFCNEIIKTASNLPRLRFCFI